MDQIGAERNEETDTRHSHSKPNPHKGKAKRRKGLDGTKVHPVNLDFDADDTNIIHRAQDAFIPRESIRYIVDGVIRQHTINVWFGRYGSKKTKAALHVGVRVAEGNKWLSFDTVKPHVLYIDTENGSDETMDNIQDLSRGENGNKFKNLFYISLADLNLHKNPQEAADALVDRIKRVHAGLTIIDPLRGIMFGGDVKSDTAMDEVFAILRRIVDETGTTFLCIHNANRNDEFFGSISIPGGVSSMIQIRSSQDSPLVKFEFQKLRRGKQEDFTGKAWFKGVEPDTSFRMTVPESHEGSADFWKSELDNVDRYVMAYLSKKGETPAKIIVSAYRDEHGGKGKPGNSLTKLKRKGYIVQPSGVKGSGYKLTKLGWAIISPKPKS
jgi:hypothetical protein